MYLQYSFRFTCSILLLGSLFLSLSLVFLHISKHQPAFSQFHMNSIPNVDDSKSKREIFKCSWKYEPKKAFVSAFFPSIHSMGQRSLLHTYQAKAPIVFPCSYTAWATSLLTFETFSDLNNGSYLSARSVLYLVERNGTNWIYARRVNWYLLQSVLLVFLSHLISVMDG